MDDTRTCVTPTCENQRGGHCYLGEDLSQCGARKPAPVDPVSGLTPRFTPNTPLPPGAVVIIEGVPFVTNEYYWLPNGTVGSYNADGVPGGKTPGIAAARALGLPLVDELDGCEAWTDERLKATFGELALDSQVTCENMRKLTGLDYQRRWKHGWICRRIPAQPKPAPAPYTVNAVDAFCRRWGPCTSLAKAESQPCCGCADHETDEPEPETVEARLIRAGAKKVLPICDVTKNGPRAYIDSKDGSIDLCIDDLTIDHAEAALLASQGKACTGCTLLQSREDALGLLTEQICKLEADVDEGDQCCAANDTEIERLAAQIGKLEADKLTVEIKRLKDKLALQEIYHAEAVYHVKSIEWLCHDDGHFCPECGESRNDGHRDNCKMGNWLARNKAV